MLLKERRSGEAVVLSALLQFLSSPAWARLMTGVGNATLEGLAAVDLVVGVAVVFICWGYGSREIPSRAAVWCYHLLVHEVPATTIMNNLSEKTSIVNMGQIILSLLLSILLSLACFLYLVYSWLNGKISRVLPVWPAYDDCLSRRPYRLHHKPTLFVRTSSLLHARAWRLRWSQASPGPRQVQIEKMLTSN